MYSFILLALTSIPSTHAWGSLGHETIAYIASHYVQSHTKTWAQGILGDTSRDYLANVATWADSYRYTAAGKFSAPFHFIDADDNPPNSCSVDYDRDCGKNGCSISAIANYTTRVQSTSLSDTEVNYALRFLVHFIGDITQPLHDEAYEVGGNDVDVTFNGTDTNLHHIWDTNMPEQLRGGYSLSDASDWANDLISAIDSGTYSSQKSSWILGLDVSDPKGTAMKWATDANTFVCSKVMPNGAYALENSNDLYPEYYNGVIDTIELQVAKAGYRLAKWLDDIAAKQSVSKRAVHGEMIVEEDLSGAHLLPRGPMSRAQRRREAMGYTCKH
ncbi:uncharacterized protein MYCFIDRAFT_150584 [Pseudocercospora fijiensis CIRAD86]|uniref:Nuclease PA3 n=1 Tax=Pseudocercospora fijiensis (strain CIRAD86) TaxID=383855 RepID=M3ALM0_PSEFD|nr:uncharacterized protein MYCFIDRAFT_150584 [Pseudocercospora fijiensis CIRAD86]EME85491.1 hypothetical protein MYCFIDRAFT_150584 [Pseudocercospora fijiensis CIRAD86]